MWTSPLGYPPPPPPPPFTLNPAGQCPSPAPCSNLSWLSYGALKGNWTLIIVNAVGAVLQTLYILVYLHYCHRKVEALPLLHALPCLAGKANTVFPRRL